MMIAGKIIEGGNEHRVIRNTTLADARHGLPDKGYFLELVSYRKLGDDYQEAKAAALQCSAAKLMTPGGRYAFFVNGEKATAKTFREQTKGRLGSGKGK